MNHIFKKKDFIMLITLFSIEAFLLFFMSLIAHFSTKEDIIHNDSYTTFASSMSILNENVLNNSFSGEGISAFKNLYFDEADVNNDSNDQICKFYTFNLSDEGISSNLLRAKDTEQINGIATNTATSTIIKSAKSDFKLGKFRVQNNYVYENIDLEKVLAKPLKIEPMDKSSILIYHVHASEGYCITENDKYKLNSYTIEGEQHNVVAAGNVLQDTIVAKTGINVIHDKTLFQEGLESSVSYNNAALRLNEIYQENNNIKLQIDLHRNSAETNGQKYGPTVEVDGVKYAQVSFVIGLDWDTSTGDRNEKINPFWEDNFKLCMLMVEKLEEKVPGICRQIELRRTPYNQGYAENSLLTEIGFAGNLSTEADTTAKLFAEVLTDIYE